MEPATYAAKNRDPACTVVPARVCAADARADCQSGLQARAMLMFLPCSRLNIPFAECIVFVRA
eukprot:5513997-Prymnesium_polylepis.1